MPARFNRILIPLIIVCSLLLPSYIDSVAQGPANHTFLPIISQRTSKWIGPYGGYIVTTSINPSNPQVVYAGTWGSGVFKSMNGGQSWQPVNHGLGNLFINSLAIDPVHPSTLYVGTYKNEVYKSQDGGITWIWSGTGIQEQAVVYALAIDPINPTTLYAGTRGVSNNGNPPWSGVVYKSVDAGYSWEPVLVDVGGEEAQDWVYSLAINPKYSNNIYAATHEHGPYHSSDSGATWYSIHDGINDDSGRSIVISPDIADTTTLYYGVWHYDTVYKSVDGGNDWYLSNRGIAFNKVYGMAIDPVHTDTVYLATFTRGILKTLDGGKSWQPGGLGTDFIYTIVIDPITSSNLFVGTAGDGLYRSVNSGLSWQHANYGIENTMPTSVIISPSDPNKIFASVYGAGVFRSLDHGQTWNEWNNGLGDKFIHALDLDPASPSLLYALGDTGGLYRDDLSDSIGWVKVGMGLPLTSALQPTFPVDHPFATYESQEYLAESHENLSVDQAANDNLLVMAYAPSNPQIAYMGTGGSGVYKTINGGTSWQFAGLRDESISSLAVDPQNPYTIYATTSQGNLKISLNGGAAWSDSALPVTFYSLATSPITPDILYAGTSTGIYHFESGTLTRLGLADHVITAIAVDKSTPGLIYAGTTSGAYYTTDGGLTWNVVDPALNDLTIQAISIYPSRPDCAYFSTKTHGIYLANIHFR
jgi:photosystem II stability/assembly factor-like uncharacterized protein